MAAHFHAPIDELRRIVGSDHVLVDPDLRAGRARYRGELRALFADLPGGVRAGAAAGAAARVDRAMLRMHAGTYATVTAFYTSNVEQYLFQQADDWKHFFANVATLPLDAKSTFIRAVFNYMGFRDPSTGTPGPRSTTMLSPILDVLKAVDEGKIQTYYDVIQLSTAPVPAPAQR